MFVLFPFCVDDPFFLHFRGACLFIPNVDRLFRELTEVVVVFVSRIFVS